MVATYIKKTMYNMVCVTGVYSRETINMFFISQEPGPVAAEIKMNNSVSDLDHISRSEQCQHF